MYISILKSRVLKVVVIALYLLLSRQQMSYGADHIIQGQNYMDEYLWTYGCTPTASAMVLSYWDNYSWFGRLIDYYYTNTCGNSNGTKTNVPNTIDELASCLGTNWNMTYCSGTGLTPSGNEAAGIECTTNSKNGYSFSVAECSECFDYWNPACWGGDGCWSAITEEIDAGRPFVWTSQGADSAHSVAVWGYRDEKYIILYDTWSPTGREDWYYLYYKGDSSDPVENVRLYAVHPGGDDGSNVKLDAPSGGETLPAYSPYKIWWYQWGTSIDNVTLDFSIDGGRNWTQIAKGVPSTSGWNSYLWTVAVPYQTTTTGRVRVMSYDATTYKAGDGTLTDFKIDYPDLIVSGLVGPTTGLPGAAINIADATQNIGAAPALASITEFYWSKDAILDGADTYLGGRSVPTIPVGATSTGNTSAHIPAEATSGTYYIIAKADANHALNESNTYNNRKTWPVKICPDLWVSALTVPIKGSPGQVITVIDKTTNSGVSAAGASETRFYWSKDTILDVADIQLGQRAVPGLAVGATSTGSTSIKIPAGAVSGTYFIIANADAAHVVVEVNEGNNTRVLPVNIRPDLVVLNMITPALGLPGQIITVSDTIMNQGTLPAGASLTRLYWSANSVLDGADTYLGQRAVPGLAVGATNTGSTSVKIPAGAPNGAYYIIAKADGANAVIEVSEDNNTKGWQMNILPDLVVSAITVPQTVLAGQLITVNVQTKNSGVTVAGASTTKLYWSTNSSFDVGDTYLGSMAVPALAAGGISSGSTPVTIPAMAPNTAYYIIANADADKIVTEANENNNDKMFVAICPDLTVSALTAPPAGVPGQLITVTDTTNNIGVRAAAASTTKLFWSTDAILDASDTELGQRAVLALDAGAVSTGTTSVTIPAVAVSGIYYIVAKADADSVVTEVDESNNTQSSLSLSIR